jgi:Na+-translocating ferredoxin:NAD+ oxidoreductase RnfD subunit
MQSFFRTPKGLLLLVLLALIALGAPAEGLAVVLPGLAAAVAVAAAIDLVLLRWRHGGWEFPSGAILTALIVGMLLSSREPWFVVAVTAAVGVVSKHVLRSRSANIFNPAAFGLMVTFYVFGTGQSWWGALPDLSWLGLAALLATGLFIADRVNKIPMVLAFLGAYYLLFTATAFAGRAEDAAEIFRTPDLQASLYFAFFILTDPPTSPTAYRDQIACGVLVAAVGFAVYESFGVVYYLLAGVVAGNLWEAWRRERIHRRRLAARRMHSMEGRA